MKYKSSNIIDVEVVKDWNWVKSVMRRGYYGVRNKWWGMRSFVKRLFSLDRMEWVMVVCLISSIVVIALMGVYLLYVLLGWEITVVAVGLMLLNMWADSGSDMKYSGEKYFKKYW